MTSRCFSIAASEEIAASEDTHRLADASEDASEDTHRLADASGDASGDTHRLVYSEHCRC
jgi:hypothetical protein